jgi:hypothetical protein
MKIGDILICKRTIGDKIIKEQKYKVDYISVYCTLNTTLPYEYWLKRNNKKIDEVDFSKEFFFSTITISGIGFSSFDIFDFFYTKQEERKIKLLKL